MNFNEKAISIKDLLKVYKLYGDKKDRLKEALSLTRRKYHKPFYALKNINIEINKGEILGIVGRNGSGKSTLLKLISGIIQPSSGSLTVNGNVSALLELGSGLNPELTGIQNIYFNGTIMGFSKEEMEEKTESIISFADIGDFIYQPFKTYSSGMKTRLAFALAINMEPEILVLDEVLAVGDELFKRKCYAKMEEFFKSDCAVIFASHILGAINELCSRAILLDRGEIILNSHPKLVTTHYQKYLFVKPERRERVRNEIIKLNKENQNILKYDTGKIDSGRKVDSGETDRYESDNKINKKSLKRKALLIEGFSPESTVITKNFNVDIFDIHIKTEEGDKVNFLIMNEYYIYAFKVKFGLIVHDIGIAVPIKTDKGLIIANYDMDGEYIKNVKKGSMLEINYRFKCIFTSGVYYTNVAIGGVVNGKRMVLNRIVDAMVFKVQPTDQNKNFRGLVSCDQQFKINSISDT